MFGYDLGLISGAILYIHDELGTTEVQEEAIVGAAKFGAVFGTFIGGAAMDIYGRRKAIAMSGGFFVIGPLIMAFAQELNALVVGRFVIGLGVGASAVAVPAYLGEMAPASRRGMVVCMYELFLCFGLLSSCVVDYALRHVSNNWRWMVGMPALPACCLAMALVLLPESPRWLLSKGDADKAFQVITKLRGKQQSFVPQLDTFAPNYSSPQIQEASPAVDLEFVEL